jgi:hypothetical protein
MKTPLAVFEIELGAVDRAASLMWLSQYPSEEEYLLPPLSFLQVQKISYRVVNGIIVRVVGKFVYSSSCKK